MTTRKDQNTSRRTAEAINYARALLKDESPADTKALRAEGARRALARLKDDAPWLEEALPLMEELAAGAASVEIAKEVGLADLASEIRRTNQSNDTWGKLFKVVFGPDSMRGHAPESWLVDEKAEKLLAAAKLHEIIASEESDD